MTDNFESLLPIAAEIHAALEQTAAKCAFAESCTGGMVVASLAGVAGISAFLCGSQVTYREDSKSSWLGVDPALIARHSAESAQVTAAMAEGLLEKTPEADIVAAVTGHLGPDAPKEKDAKVFIAIAVRRTGETFSSAVQLESTQRAQRQIEASAAVLNALLQQLTS